MREIKFRAWDKEQKKFIYYGVFSLLVDAVEKSQNVMVKNYTEFYERFIHLQFTGLKDKNGKEIYEGDVVKNCRGYNPDKNWIVEIVCEEGVFTGKIIEDNDMPWMEEPTEIFTGEHAEVIGNIYENPELLKQN